jgi:hypothetical protein
MGKRSLPNLDDPVRIKFKRRRIWMDKNGKALWLGIILLGVWALFPSSAFPARPLFTEDPGTVEKGTVELELGLDYLRGRTGDKYYAPSAAPKYGLLEKMEIGASLAYIFQDTREGERVDGWTDLTVYAKYRLWDEGISHPAFILKPLIKFGTASWRKGLGSGKTDYGPTAILGKSFSNFELYGDVSYFIVGDKEEMNYLTAGLALGYESLKVWEAVGEVRYIDHFNPNHKDDAIFINFGLRKEVGPAVFDAAMNVGLNNAAQDYGFTVGVTLRFK